MLNNFFVLNNVVLGIVSQLQLVSFLENKTPYQAKPSTKTAVEIK